MADITDIKAILYTEKSLELQERGVIVVQTSPRMTKNGLKAVFQEYFGIKPLRVNSMRVSGKVKRFKGVEGKRADFKKFYVFLPEDAKIESLAV
jgi:large subunit ribosomal protein L23